MGKEYNREQHEMWMFNWWITTGMLAEVEPWFVRGVDTEWGQKVDKGSRIIVLGQRTVSGLGR
ncbi:MAG: hypothetical protein EHM41_15020 [Chloroflexi bacterium]|nr:MAG: hypothetical protein EHM41_15020 [Chloroflexota bacterium]